MALDERSSPDEPFDPQAALARMRADLDQAFEGARDLARVAWSMFDGLREAGFDEAQAMTLTVAWLTATCGYGGGESGSE